ncbi:MAG: response regulator [Candidatus Omnitrophota bacterium]
MDKKKILVVDDEPQLLAVLKTRLESNNYEVITAVDGEDGMEKLVKEMPDLILLDIKMPKKDGYTFVKEMRANRDVKGTPVIILTARDKMKDLFAMEGIKEYIVKPFKSEELLESISKCLSEKGCS